MYIVLIISIMLFVTPFALMLYDKIMGKHILCDTFGWHNGRGGRTGFDGCSFHAACSKCGKEVMQDSQGNWF